MEPELSIVIVTYNSAHDIEACLDSVLPQCQSIPVELFVVDNASFDGTVDLVRTRYPTATIIANALNRGFPAGNNQALRLAKGNYVLLLNPDTIALPGSIAALLGYMRSHSECGVCGPRLQDISGRIWPDVRRPTLAVLLLNMLRVGNWVYARDSASVSVVQGCCMVMSRAAVDAVGLLDENLFWCEDVDYCVRVVRSGLSLAIVETAAIVHVGGQSGKQNVALMLQMQYVSKARYFAKNQSRICACAAAALLLFEATLKAVTWTLISVTSRKVEAGVRARAYRVLLPKLAGAVVEGACGLS